MKLTLLTNCTSNLNIRNTTMNKMKMKRITSKCEYVTPAIKVINVVDMDTLLTASPDVRPGTDVIVEPPIDDDREELEG